MAAPGITVLKHNVPWGPFTRAQIDEALRRGDVTVQYLAHAPGLTEWLPLGEVLDYVDKSAFAPTLPPVPDSRDFPPAKPVPPPVPLSPTSQPPILPSARPYAPAPMAVPAPAVPPEAVAQAETVFEPAPFFARAFAFVLDVAILFVPTALVYALCALFIWIPSLWQHPNHQALADQWELLARNMRRLLWLVAVGIGWLYGAGLESSAAQATIGKRWMGMKVTDLAGERISFLRATGRYAAKYLSALPCFLGFMAALFSPRRLALHDRLAGTRVVRS